MSTAARALVIREEQMKAFADARREHRPGRMESHMRRFFPQECDALGRERVRAAVQHGIERAARYGCASEQAICKYISVMFAFGKDFDEAPWAAEILAKDDPKVFEPRIDRLVRACSENASEATGIHTKAWRE